MHKDKPPGIFDFAERSIRHLIGFWLISGFILSVLVHFGLLIWRADKPPPPDRPSEALENKTAAQRSPSTTSSSTVAPDAVKY